MISVGGYTLRYEKKKNRIVISLPQTFETMADTATAMSNRKTELTSHEEAVILGMVRAIMEER